MACVVCGDARNSLIECEECGKSICFSCSGDQISSRYICCCCHKYEFKPSKVFYQLERSDFEVWFQGFVKRKLENAIEIKTKLHQIINGFLKETYYRLPAISGMYPLLSVLKKLNNGVIRTNLFIQTDEKLVGLEEIQFNRFVEELERFISDNSYILYMPQAPIKIEKENPTIRRFIETGERYLSRYNSTLISTSFYAFEKNHILFEDISSKMYRILRASPFKVLSMPREGKAEGICENCNNGILYLDDEKSLRCSICGAKYCYECLRYVNEDEVESHTCEARRVEEVKEIRAVSSICPFCGRRIQKVEDTCNDMFCVFCHRGFNYVTRDELNYEFENEERKEWLNENGQDYDTSLSAQFRKMPIEILKDAILGLIFSRKSISPIIDFLGNSKILEYATRVENSVLVKKNGISSKIYIVEAEIFKDEFIDFTYMYFEEFTKMIEEENSFNNILVMNASIDLILRKIDFLHILADRMRTLYPDIVPIREFYSIVFRTTMLLNSNLKKWIETYVVESPDRSMFSLNTGDYKSLYSATVESIIEKTDLTSLIDRFPSFYRSLVECDGYTPQIRINMRGRYKDITEDLVVDGVEITEEIINSSSFRVKKDEKIVGTFTINHQ